MNIVPKVGMADISFGMDETDVVTLLGPPVSQSLIADIDTHPKSRKSLDYGDRDVLVTPELGVISITLEADQTTVELWGARIDQMNPQELANFLGSNACVVHVEDSDGWGDQDVNATQHGIIASFSEQRFEIVEVYDPIVRQK